MSNAIPEISSPIDPASLMNPIEIHELLKRRTQIEIECMMPARALSYDKNTRIVEAQPLCDYPLNTGKHVERKPIKVHLWTPLVNEKALPFGIKEGSTGWLIAADFDTRTQLSDPTKSSAPNTNDIHRYRFGIFLPDSFDPTVEEGTGGGGGQDTTLMFYYDKDNKTIGDGVVMVRRQPIFIDESDISNMSDGTGFVYIKITHQNGSDITAGIYTINSQTFPASTSTNTNIPLYKLDSWTIEKDYRFSTSIALYE